MKKCLFTALALVVLLRAGFVFGAAFEGPLQVKNQFPIFLPVDQPYLEQARTETSLSLSLSHSSVFVMRSNPQWVAHMDIELTELNIRYKKDLPGLFEFGIDVPVVRASAGFMDRPLDWYHRTFGFPDYGRHTRPRNEFLYDIEKDGSPLIEGDNDKTGFGDIRLTFKKKLLEGPLAAAVLADVELPTGDARIGYGSGSTDAGSALLIDYDVRHDARLYANLGVVFPGELRAYQTVPLRTFAYGGSGLEFLAGPHLGLLAQFMVQTSPYPRTGISQIDVPGVLLVLGARYYGASGSYELSLTEDPDTSGAPDFILNLTYKKRF